MSHPLYYLTVGVAAGISQSEDRELVLSQQENPDMCQQIIVYFHKITYPYLGIFGYY